MELEEAERIVNEYGGVLEKAAVCSSAYPVSMLPCDKATIKRAILSYIAALKTLGQLGEDIRNDLGVGYLQLAAFIEDHDAERVRAFQEAWSRSAVTADKVEHFALVSGADFEHHQGVLERISEEQRTFLAELRDFEKSIGLKLHYSDDPDEAQALAMEAVRKRFGLTQSASAEPAPKGRRIRWRFWRR